MSAEYPEAEPWLRSFLREIRASGWLFQSAQARCESHSMSENVRLRILAEVELAVRPFRTSKSGNQYR
jgi:hypothetical protein